MSLEQPINPSTNRGADSSLERRAEELRRRFSVAASQVVQQREFFLETEEVLEQLKDTIASLRQDLDRISAEREAYREALKVIADGDSWKLGADAKDNIMRHGFESLDLARRILAEKGRT